MKKKSTKEPLPLVVEGSPKHLFTLLCDDIRQEQGGRISCMGLYDNHLVIPSVPFTLPKLCFYTKFSSLKGTWKFSFAIETPDGERRGIIEGTDVEVPEGSEEGIFNVVAAPFEIIAEGEFGAVLILEQGETLFETTYKFLISDAERLQREFSATSN